MNKNVLNEYEELFSILEDSMEGYIFLCDMQSNYSRWSKKAVEYFNLPGSVIYNMPELWVRYIHPEDRHIFLEDFEKILSGESDIHNCEYRVMNRYGSYIWLVCKGKVVRNEKGEILYFAGAMTNLGNTGKYDSTTNLKNIYEFRTDLSRLLPFDKKETVGIMMIGINRFSQINEKYTYMFGNQVLRRFGHRLLEKKDKGMTVYRMDGDKFACIYPGADQKQLLNAFRKFQECAQGSELIEGEEVSFSIYGGALFYPQNGSDTEEIHRNLEYAFHTAKRKNDQKLVFFEERMLNDYLREIQLQDDLLESVNDGCRGFFLCYQPIIHTADEKLDSCEALLRWKNKEGNVVSPSEFIPILESTGAIRKVGCWVLENALKQLKEWQKNYPALKMNVNVSYIQLQNGEFVDFVVEKLKQYDVLPESLVLELTETNKIMDIDQIQEEFEFFRGRGIRIALDDFGTGYASVSVLRDLVIDGIKIDHSFVSKLMNNRSDRHIIEYLIKLCQKLHIEVCVEGIEKSEIKKIVESYLPDTMQGYHFSRPVEADVFYKKYLA